MVEFNTPSYTAMDRQYHERIEVDPVRASANIEEPIIPIGELGQTIVEVDPTGRHKNMIQVAQAAIRSGAKKMQLMIQTQPGSPMGGLKSHGKEVREQMREVFKANEAILEGIEMPTAMSNLSGYDPQRGTFDDEKLKQNMDEVKDAIRFAADVAQGGEVDILSWEFARPLFNAEWNKDGMFEESGEPMVQVVDERTGQIQQWRVNNIEKVPVAKDPNTGKPYVFIPEIGRFASIDEDKKFETEYTGDGKYVVKQDGKTVNCVDKLQPWTWKQYEEWAGKKGITPEEYFAQQQAETAVKQARGWAATYREHAKSTHEHLTTAKSRLKAAQEAGDTEKIRENQEKISHFQEKYKQEVDSLESYEQQAAENEEKAKFLKPISVYAKNRSVDSYAKLGIAARQETVYNKNVNRPISVGPEIGWPHAYGGHPAEFKELIHDARTRMVDLMTSKHMIDPQTNQPIMDPNTRQAVANPYFEPGMSRSEAELTAKKHIKGCFDTGHMGMWLQHFKPELPWDQRVKEFNTWYMDEIKKLAKDDIVGSIQLVDSMSGAHGHLPAGQGIFPVVEAAKEFKRNDFKGFMISEGHEEEKFNEGRILVETWKAFNAPIGSSYGPGAPGMRDLQDRYQGRTYSPRMMFGGYTPPFGEYKPWSEIPFE
jgi:hypothetical protein